MLTNFYQMLLFIVTLNKKRYVNFFPLYMLSYYYFIIQKIDF